MRARGISRKAESLLRKVIALNPKEAALSGRSLYSFLSRSDGSMRPRRNFGPGSTPIRAIARSVLIWFASLISLRDLTLPGSELESRIKAGGDVFDYQLALAELNFAQNKISRGDASAADTGQHGCHSGQESSPRRSSWPKSMSARTTLPPPSR